MTDDLTGRRLKDVIDNIRKDLKLLKDFEDELRLETDLHKMAKYDREIKRQRESLATYWKEYEELKKQAAPAQIQNVAELLQQNETNLNKFQKQLNQKLLPHIWNIPHIRNPNFTGRDEILSGLRGALGSGEPATCKQTLTGLGGVGKSQLAIEYIYRNMVDYRVVWWIRSEELAFLAADYADLASSLDLKEKDSRDQQEKVRAVKRWLEHNEGWLLVFDNANDPEETRNYLPQSGAGHVIITSRNPNWSSISKLLPVKVFNRSESIDFLCKRTGQDDKKTARNLAGELGDLPLALEQAGAYIETTVTPMKEYLKLFRERRKELWEDESSPPDYPQPVGATWSLAMDRVRGASPEGANLLNLCSFLAPDDITLELVREGAEHIPPQLAAAVTDRLVMNRAIRVLRQYSLIEAIEDSLSVHRLVQVVVRDRLNTDETKLWAGSALRILSKVFPYKSDDIQTWPLSKRLLPHALAAIAHAEEHMVAQEEMGDILNKTGMYFNDHAESSKAKANFEKALTFYVKVHGHDHFSVATSLNNIGVAWATLGDSKKATSYYEEALEIDMQVYGAKHSTVAKDLNNIGAAWGTLGDSKKAISYFKQSIAINMELYGEKYPDIATGLNNIGKELDALGESEKAISYFERAIEINKEAYGEKHPDIAPYFSNIGLALNALGESKKAISYFEQAIAINKEAYGEKHPKIAIDLSNIGLALNALGESEKAISYFEQAIAINKEAYGEKHPYTATYLNNIGQAWDALGESEKAISYFEQSIAINKEVYGDKHPKVAIGFNNIGLAWNVLGESEKAISYFERALAIDIEVYGVKHPDVATDLHSIGLAWNALGESEKGISYYEQSLAINMEVYGVKHPHVATDLSNIGAAWYAHGDPEKAISYYEPAIVIGKELYGERHPLVATYLSNIGLAWNALGDCRRAKEYFQHSYDIFREFYGDVHPNTKTVKIFLDSIIKKL